MKKSRHTGNKVMSLFISSTLFLFLLSFSIPGNESSISYRLPTTPPDSTTVVSVLTTGDAMAHLPQTNAAYNDDSNAYIYDDVFKWIKPVVHGFDLRIINFETTLGGTPYKGYPQFSAPDSYARDLHEAGFNFFLQANNHAVDRYSKGVIRTIDVLDGFGIDHTGTFRNSDERDSTYPVILEMKGIRIALLNVTFSTNGIKPTAPVMVNMVDKEQIKNDLAKAREQNPDVIMVAIHWGAEYKNYPNSYQKNIADFLIEQGVDVIIGHHPHVLQPVEWKETTYNGEDKKVLVIWSLGNFYSNQRARYKNGGMFVNFDIIKHKKTCKTKIDNVTFYPYWVYKRSSPLEYVLFPCEMKDSLAKMYNISSSALSAFKTFTNDSRSHLMKNGAVKELLHYTKK